MPGLVYGEKCVVVLSAGVLMQLAFCCIVSMIHIANKTCCISIHEMRRIVCRLRLPVAKPHTTWSHMS